MADPLPHDSSEISETDLAYHAGIARSDLKKLRDQLEQEKDWRGGNGRPVIITREGRDKLQFLIAQHNGAADALARATAAAARVDRYVCLICSRVISPRMLLGKKKDAGPGDPFLRVLVKPTVNFRPGMQLERCEPSRTAGVFYYHGRAPRRPGKF